MSANRAVEPVGGFTHKGITYVSFECVIMAYGCTYEDIVRVMHETTLEVIRYRGKWFMADWDALAMFAGSRYAQS